MRLNPAPLMGSPPRRGASVPARRRKGSRRIDEPRRSAAETQALAVEPLAARVPRVVERVFVAAAEAQYCAVVQHDLVVAAVLRDELADRGELDERRAVDAQETVR